MCINRQVKMNTIPEITPLMKAVQAMYSLGIMEMETQPAMIPLKIMKSSTSASKLKKYVTFLKSVCSL